MKFLSTDTIIIVGIVLIALMVSVYVYKRNQLKKNFQIIENPEILEELEEKARKTAEEHSVSLGRNIRNWPIYRMNDNYNFITKVYRDLNEEVMKKRTVTPASEWLLDNYYIIEEQVKGIRVDLDRKLYDTMPDIGKGTFKGNTRVLSIATELVTTTNGQIDENQIMRYLQIYQEKNILLDREIWILPMMIRIALIEEIRQTVENIGENYTQWAMADDLFEKWILDDVPNLDSLLKLMSEIPGINEKDPHLLEHLFYKLRRSGKGYLDILNYFNVLLEKDGTSIEQIANKEHDLEAMNSVAMGNSIKSLKDISGLDWTEIFEKVSFNEAILRKDPLGVYELMDMESRNRYRREVEKLAKAYRIPELEIAKKAITMAEQFNASLSAETNDIEKDKRKSHIGYYLLGNGRKSLEDNLEGHLTIWENIRLAIKKRPGLVYIGSICLLIFLILLFVISYAARFTGGERTWLLILTGLLVLIPASEIAISFVTRLATEISPPSFIPKLLLEDGIPEEMITVVAIPALFTNKNRVRELMENMEEHYLANPEKNLYFAIVGAFGDSDKLKDVKDNEVLREAYTRIRELNAKYAANGEEIFYFFNRVRTYSESDGKWIGWERKRGALLEFNNMIMGSKDTTFSAFSSLTLPEKNIKYVITLDADSVLPLGMAKKMIGAMAHPLNTAVLDEAKGIVVEGYGLMQPRISFDMDSSNKTTFSRIYTGQEGIDPYASAISDVYQDLFEEGIFTGKGIYDLKTYQRVLEDAIPENMVLSHDLLEGSYVRAALVTDLTLVDSYPSKYISYMKRLHRWIRGDWQLIPWLKRNIFNRKMEKVSNPLSYVSKYKMLDNLRRSLVSPALMILLLAGVTVLPGSSFFYMGIVILTLAFPLFIGLLGVLFSGGFRIHRLKRHLPGFFGFKASLFQFFLSVVFLPYAAYVALNAILVTLYRVLVTKKNMLEWVTFADVELMNTDSMENYVRTMGPSASVGIVMVILSYFLKPEGLMISVPFLLIFLASPYIAYMISKDKSDKEELLFEEDLISLRKTARKTWRYFEEFSNAKNNYLAPDNFQVDPPRGITNRTSSTNIGFGLLAVLSAKDLGYIGLEKTYESIERTLTTMEKMEKWNGHLYNWYETITLRPLYPKYVSTVDSGNLIGYLITLSRGLEDYYAQNIIDCRYVQGLNDTIRNGLDEGEDFPDAFNLFNFTLESEKVNLYHWKEALDEAEIYANLWEPKKPVWKIKVLEMINSLKKETDDFFPWIDSVLSFPNIFKQEDFVVESNKLIAALKKNAKLKDMESHQREIMDLLSAFEMKLSLLPADSICLATNWITETRKKVNQSSEFTSNFLANYDKLIHRIDEISNACHFDVLFNDSKKLFSIGFDIEENKLTNSYYDMLASEARQASYIAIARGEVPSTHWFRLSRNLTMIDQYKGLVSWSGTMFEYLMPLLIMRTYGNTLLDESYYFAVESQMKYGKQRKIPWGASESCFNSFDSQLDYQYKANGVPWLGLKRGLVEDAVIAPYATFLALMVKPHEAFLNIQRLKLEGLDGPYGFYEAADYTKERLTLDTGRAIVKTYMAHHQGMTLVAINNHLNENVMQKRFSNDPQMKAASLLLQEKVPMNVVFTKETKEKIPTYKVVVQNDQGAYRVYAGTAFDSHKAHILSNGNYAVMLTESGSGYSRKYGMDISRYREDPITDHSGMFFYVKDIKENSIWSATSGPLNKKPDDYNVTYTPDKATYMRIDGDMVTNTQVAIVTGDSAEVRSIHFGNTGESVKEMEVTSYFEPVLASNAQDMAHPAYSNLFIMTEYHEQYHALIAHRRKRSEEDEEVWLAHILFAEPDIIEEIQYETERNSFLGRGNSVQNPYSITSNRPLTNTVGAVLDPIMSLRAKFRVKPGKETSISYITVVSGSRQDLLLLMEKYTHEISVESIFNQAKIRSEVEYRYLNIKAEEMVLYQEMIGSILFNSRQRLRYIDQIRKNTKGQSALWPYGISGDRPIVMVIIENSEDIGILTPLLKAHEYWRMKEMNVDLLIICREESSYASPLYNLIKEIAYSKQNHEVLKRYGDMFIVSSNIMAPGDMELFCAVSRLIFNGTKGSIKNQLKLDFLKDEKIFEINEGPPVREKIIKELTREIYSHAEEQAISAEDNFTSTWIAEEVVSAPPLEVELEKELDYYNGFGGFNKEGNEYVIKLEDGLMTPLPWTNVIANEEFGFLVTESGGGFSWAENSRENKISPWTNDPVSDPPVETFYLKDELGSLWTLTPLPIRESEPYTISHGFGYTKFRHKSHGLKQCLTQFVPVVGKEKISLISLYNEGDVEKVISMTYYVKPVLGVNAEETNMHIKTNLEKNGMLTAINPYNLDFPNRIVFLGTSGEISSVSGDLRKFIGTGSRKSPEALERDHLDDQVGIGYIPAMLMQVKITIQPKETKEIVFVLGMSKEVVEAEKSLEKYRKISTSKEELDNVKKFWSDKLERVKVNTPDTSMDLMLNGWFTYQVIACRLWARAGYYQVGGAYGFRDQLQDCLSLLHVEPNLAREQILKHARHQFEEGDVLHWWHEPKGKGTRTKISDDYVWLPYVVAEYMSVTGDKGILLEMEPFLTEEVLGENEHDRYCEPKVTIERFSIYEHCLRSLNHAMNLGIHGIPLMEGGDWNDGMNMVGAEGIGESIWLGWFLSATLLKFIPVIEENGGEELASYYRGVAEDISAAIEKYGWDGNWYNRAFFDDGEVLGSSRSTEAKIDAIAQSWAVISGLGDKDRTMKAMESLEHYLVDRNEGIIKLLTPPFDTGNQEPGYIKGYIPGVRENGGQYSHAAAWTIMAFALLGDGNKATELFNMINPINHATTNRESFKYKAEPYVMAADVYANPSHMGRGGWTWYTGSASWMQKVGLESILGFKKIGETLEINPCIPKRWAEYSIKYKYMDTTYDILVSNPNAVSKGVIDVSLDGNVLKDNKIHLQNDQITHTITVTLGKHKKI
ncbi:MAG: glucoamylase family protein [Clostridiaceae bacterium]